MSDSAVHPSLPQASPVKGFIAQTHEYSQIIYLFWRGLCYKTFDNHNKLARFPSLVYLRIFGVVFLPDFLLLFCKLDRFINESNIFLSSLNGLAYKKKE